MHDDIGVNVEAAYIRQATMLLEQRVMRLEALVAELIRTVNSLKGIENG